MFDKINVFPIIREHLHTLRDARSDKYRVSDFLVMFGAPAVAAGLLVWRKVYLHEVVVILTAVAILAGLLFNLLLIIFDAAVSAKRPEAEGKPSYRQVLEEVHANVAFAVFVAVVLIAILIVPATASGKGFGATLSGVSYYLMFVFLLTLLMILKRIHVLLRNELRTSDAEGGRRSGGRIGPAA